MGSKPSRGIWRYPNPVVFRSLLTATDFNRGERVSFIGKRVRYKKRCRGVLEEYWLQFWSENKLETVNLSLAA